ncbi:hypothetical protein [Kitasatospora sp. NPDC088779]|uniref:hypothetical protein n=1 Tax=Kitasatospora sp. NPDC088779 TaxID=3154964 RepID=UPI0034167D4B
MTDKLPGRESGGRDGDGPAETATERLLREAMNARASLITAHDLRPAQPPRGRVRRLRPVYLTAVPVFALAASLAIGLLTFHGDPLARKDVPPPAATMTTSPSPTPEPTAAPTPTATSPDTGSPAADPETGAPLSDPTSAGTRTTAPPTTPATTPATTAPAGTTYPFRGVRFKIPPGWRAVNPDPSANILCILSPSAPQDATAGDCLPHGVLLTVTDQESQLWPRLPDLDSESGWSTQPWCPAWSYSPTLTRNGQIDSVGPTRSTPTVAGRAARKSQWQINCGGDAFTAQMWALPKDFVSVSAIGLKADYQPGLMTIVNTLDLSGRQAPPVKYHENDIDITVGGFTGVQELKAGSPAVTFSVTYKNNSPTNFAQVEPLVYTEWPVDTPVDVVSLNAGKLERLDGATWKEKPLTRGSAMDYAMADPESLFPLAPGQSRTVKYRMTIDAGHGLGPLWVMTRAVLPYAGGTLTGLGNEVVSLKITK